MYPVYCHMSSLSSKCGGGGWTLVMKLDRNKVKYCLKQKQECLTMNFKHGTSAKNLIIGLV